jgi:hypothetical protein
MIRPEDLLQRLRQRPFQPFRVVLTDGRAFEIHYPDLNIVGQTWFDIGIPMPNQADPFGERAVTVPLDWIARVEELSPNTSKAS